MLNRSLILGILITCTVAFAQPQPAASAAPSDSKLEAREQLDLGMESYKAQKYEAAIEHFKSAAALDPGLPNVKLYLGTAYSDLYVPGADSLDNTHYLRLAIAEFKEVLVADPQNIIAIKGIASLLLSMKKLDESKEYYRRAMKVDPNDPENYYSAGVIDWMQTYAPRMELRANLRMKRTDSLIGRKACAKIRALNAEKIEEGIKMLSKAIELNRDYVDAMAYMNLMYRERAECQCGNRAARDADLKAADDWEKKKMTTEAAKGNRQ